MTTCTTKRASKGGEFGANGEWYEGGKFINTFPENRKKEGSQPRKERKVQIEPYMWVVSNQRPLFRIVGAGAIYIDRNNPKLGIMSFMPAFNGGVMYNGMTIEEVKSICERYNAGERLEDFE